MCTCMYKPQGGPVCQQHVHALMRRDSWEAQVSPPAAPVQAYLDELEQAARQDPLLVVAHAWTQHMALLAGGQRVRQLVLAARPAKSGNAGTSLFVFHVRL